MSRIKNRDIYLKDNDQIYFGDSQDSAIWFADGKLQLDTVISGVDPTESYHLSTKNYVDTEITTISGDIVSQIPTDYYTQGQVDSLVAAASGTTTLIGLTDTPSGYNDGLYLKSTASGTEWATVSGGGGTSNHSELNQLDYTSAGHTGFQPTGNYVTDTEITTISGALNDKIGAFGGIDEVEYITISADNITNKYTVLANTPYSPTEVALDVGCAQEYGVDFTVSGTQLSWNGLGLDGIIAENEVIRVAYNYATVNTVSGSNNHSKLNQLDYASAGHTGFQPAGSYVTDTEMTTISGDIVGQIITDHGALTGLDGDDHTQYLLADGARAFTGTVSGVTPTEDAHLATKAYIDSNAIPNVDSYGGLENAITAIGATEMTVVINTAQTLIADQELVSTLSVIVLKGGSIDGAYTLTINGPFDAGHYQIFGSSITITNLKIVDPYWWGAIGDGIVDNADAFSAAIAALPVGGGKIPIGPGIWDLSTDPSVGVTKTIYYDIYPGATFSGAGSGAGQFNAMRTNSMQLATGPYIKSYDGIPSASGGIGAHNIEVVQDADAGDKVAVAQYLGATTQASGGHPAGVWGQNIVVLAEGSSTNNVIGIEIDLGRSTTSTSEVKGIQITGTGLNTVQTGLEINHLYGFEYGITIGDSKRGILIECSEDNPSVGIVITPKSTFEATTCGIVVGAYGITQAGVAAVFRQLSDTKDTIMVFRNTDSTPTGAAFRVVNAANSAEICKIDVNGNIITDGYIAASGILKGYNIRLTGAATANTGEVSLGAGYGWTVGAAGGAAELPATPMGYLIAYIETTAVRIPYYGAP